RDIRLAGLLRCWWVDELRRESVRRPSPGRHICRANTQGREAYGLTRRASQQVRTGHQRASREDTEPRCAVLAAGTRRRGDRIVLCLAALIWRLVDLAVRAHEPMFARKRFAREAIGQPVRDQDRREWSEIGGGDVADGMA